MIEQQYARIRRAQSGDQWRTWAVMTGLRLFMAQYVEWPR